MSSTDGAKAKDKGLALITGASAGLGAEYAKLFAADGHPVALVARRRERLEELAATLEAEHGVKAWAIAADLGTDEGPPAVKAAVDEVGVPLYALVNNAGYGSTGRFVDNPLEKELGQLRVNIEALTWLTHLFLPELIARGEGRVLNVGSTAGFQPGPYMAVYYATKAYVNSFTEALAWELRGTGVTATVHCPGPTATEFGAIAGNDKSTLFQKMSVATAEECARHGYAAMKAGRPISVHRFMNKIGASSVRFTPRSVINAVAARLNQPSS